MEGWAELRREHFVRGASIKELARRTGLSRNTVRAALRAAEPPRYERAPAGSKLDPFKGEIHRLLVRFTWRQIRHETLLVTVRIAQLLARARVRSRTHRP